MVKWITDPNKKGEWQKIDVPEQFFDNSLEDSCTDKSHYRPDAPMFSRVEGPSRVGIYDFNDGVDNGLDLTPLRRRGIDETELQVCIERLKHLSAEQLQDLKETAAQAVVERSKELEKESKDTQSNSSTSGSSTSSSS